MRRWVFLGAGSREVLKLQPEKKTQVYFCYVVSIVVVPDGARIQYLKQIVGLAVLGVDRLQSWWIYVPLIDTQENRYVSVIWLTHVLLFVKGQERLEQNLSNFI